MSKPNAAEHCHLSTNFCRVSLSFAKFNATFIYEKNWKSYKIQTSSPTLIKIKNQASVNPPVNERNHLKLEWKNNHGT